MLLWKIQYAKFAVQYKSPSVVHTRCVFGCRMITEPTLRSHELDLRLPAFVSFGPDHTLKSARIVGAYTTIPRILALS